MRQIRIRGGIIGCGAIMDIQHMPIWRTIKEVEIAAVCDQRKETAEATARRWNIHAAYSDISQMLDREKLDFVDICTPPLTNFPLAIQVINVNIHVLLEKPMALTLNEANELSSAAHEHNIKLCVMHNNLYSPIIMKALSLINAGAIGEILSVEIHWLDRSERYLSKQDHWCHSLPGGIFGEYGPHPVYLASAFLNNIHPVGAITRKSSNYPWATADELKVLLQADNGSGSISISCNAPLNSLTLDIFGTERNLHVNVFTQVMTLTRQQSGKIHDLVLDRCDLILPVVTAATSGALNRIVGRNRNDTGNHLIMRKFVESIRDDAAPPVTAEDGRETTRILEEIWELVNQAH